MNGIIFDIQRFCINDGPGIRTTVFMKGCPIKCLWCHNPESQSPKREIMRHRDKCTGCKRCTGITAEDDFLCLNGGMEICGREISVDDAVSEALKDEVFYSNSGGGVTVSGGEPFFQVEFLTELIKKLKQKGIHTAIETCGLTKSENIAAAAKYTDLFLYDCKETDGTLHRRFTGADNSLILENLALLNRLGKDVVLRCPIVKGCNDREEHFCAVADLANKYENILQVELEPYHPLGEGKSIALGRAASAFRVASDEEKDGYLRFIQSKTDKKVKFA